MRRVGIYLIICALALGAMAAWHARDRIFASKTAPAPWGKKVTPPPVSKSFEAIKDERFVEIIADAARVQSCDLLIIGDSITAGLHATHRSGRVFAAGVSGSGVGDWRRHAPELLRVIKPRSIILALGVNDARRARADLAGYLDDYGGLCRDIRARTESLAVATILPVRKGADSRLQFGSRQDPEILRRMNAGIAHLARGNGYRVIDAHGALAAADGMMPQEFTFDGVHLTEQGYAAWKKALFGGSGGQ